MKSHEQKDCFAALLDERFGTGLPEYRAGMKYIGLGTAGMRILERMRATVCCKAESIAVGVDGAVLSESHADHVIDLNLDGERLTSVMQPNVGSKLLLAREREIMSLLEDATMVILVGGLGRGTCSGAAPLLAEWIRTRLDTLVIGIFSTPYLNEGNIWRVQADIALDQLMPNLDSLFLIANNDLAAADLVDSWDINNFSLSDQYMTDAATALAEIVFEAGVVNLDASDLITGMHRQGSCLIARFQLDSRTPGLSLMQRLERFPPAAGFSFSEVNTIYINVKGGRSLGMLEMDAMVEAVRARLLPDADVFWGLGDLDSHSPIITVSVVACCAPVSSKRIISRIDDETARRTRRETHSLVS
ncbi:hypothetical protein JW905_08075 [bacterium]|nr:hypothetical protein [candidate division CSSED10-310 bacterium]